MSSASSRPMMGSVGSSSSTVTSAGPYPESGTVLQILGCPKMTQHWKCLGIRADSGAKILVILEIGQKIEIG